MAFARFADPSVKWRASGVEALRMSLVLMQRHYLHYW
jgi:hypothetical protein